MYKLESSPERLIMTTTPMKIDMSIDNGIDAQTRIRITEGLAHLLADTYTRQRRQRKAGEMRNGRDAKPEDCSPQTGHPVDRPAGSHG